MILVILVLVNVCYATSQNNVCLDYYIQCDNVLSNYMWVHNTYNQLTNRYVCIDLLTTCKYFN